MMKTHKLKTEIWLPQKRTTSIFILCRSPEP